MATNNATDTSSPITVAQGGTGVATNTTAYAVICAGTTATGVQQTTASAGTAGQPLVSGGASALPSYVATLPVANGGSGVATHNVAYSVLCSGTTATGAVQNTASAGTAGQALISNGASALPSFQTLPDQTPPVDETSTAVTMVPDTIYSANNAALVTFTIPPVVPFGSTFYISGYGAGGWTIQCNTGQIINFGSTPTSSAGTLSSTHRYDSVLIFCNVADSRFTVLGGPQGNLTVA